jgi:hypothetical protein
MTNAFVDVLDSEIVQAVIRKPFDIDMLSTVVGEIVAALEGRGLERQALPFLQVKNAAPRGRSIT